MTNAVGVAFPFSAATSDFTQTCDDYLSQLKGYRRSLNTLDSLDCVSKHRDIQAAGLHQQWYRRPARDFDKLVLCLGLEFFWVKTPEFGSFSTSYSISEKCISAR